MLKDAIFDIDGTLIDSLDLRADAWSRAFAEQGYRITAGEIRAQLGGGDAPVSAFLDDAARTRDGEAIQAARDRIFHADCLRRLQPLPQVPALLAALHERQVRVALASASPGPERERYGALLGGAELIEAAASPDAGQPGAAPDLFQAAMDALMPLDRERTLAFGATPRGIKAATRLGLRIVGLRCGGFSDAELDEAGALRLYDDPAELTARLDEILLLV